MKLWRFTAVNTQKAMADIYQKLGPDAMIYTTRQLSGGSVEVVAGLPVEEEAVNNVKENTQKDIFPDFSQPMQSSCVATDSMNQGVLDRLNQQLLAMDANIQKLSHQMSLRSLGQSETPSNESMQRQILFHYLNRMNLGGHFAHYFADEFITKGAYGQVIDEVTVGNKLQEYLLTESHEFIDQKNICALIGPTGIGKTTTIAKLAKRYISRYGSKSLGLITTDYSDVARKNHLRYYSQMLDADLEYANTEPELVAALHTMKDKKLILIDTHGASQRDYVNVAKLLTFLESQGNKISSYLTLPCNVQEQILDEVARAFISTNLRGCILTKQDESISIAPAVSVSMNYKLPIAYVCTGQNVNTDIEKADPQKIIRQMTTECHTLKQSTDARLYQNVDRVVQKMKEGSYDRHGTC